MTISFGGPSRNACDFSFSLRNVFGRFTVKVVRVRASVRVRVKVRARVVRVSNTII